MCTHTQAHAHLLYIPIYVKCTANIYYDKFLEISLLQRDLRTSVSNLQIKCFPNECKETFTFWFCIFITFNNLTHPGQFN